MGTKKILAIASGGGHFVQLRRMRPAWEGCEVKYVTTLADYRSEIEDHDTFACITDANRNQRFRVVVMALQIFWIAVKFRPDTVVSTGAAPGYFALRIGRLLGAQTVWVDSIANAEELSMTGRMVRKHADLWMTQWPELAGTAGPTYAGEVI